MPRLPTSTSTTVVSGVSGRMISTMNGCAEGGGCTGPVYFALATVELFLSDAWYFRTASANACAIRCL